MLDGVYFFHSEFSVEVTDGLINENFACVFKKNGENRIDLLLYVFKLILALPATNAISDRSFLELKFKDISKTRKIA